MRRLVSVMLASRMTRCSARSSSDSRASASVSVTPGRGGRGHPPDSVRAVWAAGGGNGDGPVGLGGSSFSTNSLWPRPVVGWPIFHTLVVTGPGWALWRSGGGFYDGTVGTDGTIGTVFLDENRGFFCVSARYGGTDGTAGTTSTGVRRPHADSCRRGKRGRR